MKRVIIKSLILVTIAISLIGCGKKNKTQAEKTADKSLAKESLDNVDDDKKAQVIMQNAQNGRRYDPSDEILNASFSDNLVQIDDIIVKQGCKMTFDEFSKLIEGSKSSFEYTTGEGDLKATTPGGILYYLWFSSTEYEEVFCAVFKSDRSYNDGDTIVPDLADKLLYVYPGNADILWDTLTQNDLEAAMRLMSDNTSIYYAHGLSLTTLYTDSEIQEIFDKENVSSEVLNSKKEAGAEYKRVEIPMDIDGLHCTWMYRFCYTQSDEYFGLREPVISVE